jgi:O-antigen ligase
MTVINELYALEAVMFKVLLQDPGSIKRVGSIYNQPNMAGHTIAVFLPILTGFALLPGRKWIARLLLMITAIFLGFLLLLTGSRGAMITATVGLVMLVFYAFRFSLLPVALILGGLFIFNWSFVTKLFLDVRFDSVEDRIDLIYFGFKTVMEHPLLGIGLKQFQNHFHDMPFYLLGRTSHNAYLEIAVEMGILGLGVFVTFLIYVGFSVLSSLWVDFFSLRGGLH